MNPITYPARPINGGPFDKALPKHGNWIYSPKYNGWRALVHLPTYTIFNRTGERLAIESEFAPALKMAYRKWSCSPLRNAGCEWLDCEGLERRHNIGKGSLIVLDAVIPNMPCSERLNLVQETFGGPLHYACPPSDNSLHVAGIVPGDLTHWSFLKSENAGWSCDFYEGLVAKRAESTYPIQLRSSKAETPMWVKHRWAW